MFIFVVYFVLSIATLITINLLVHHFVRVKKKNHRVLIKNDLSDNGIRMAEQFVRSGVSVTILDHSGRDTHTIIHAVGRDKPKTNKNNDGSTMVKCYAANASIDTKVEEAISLLENEFGPNFTIVDSARVAEPLALYDVWWLFSVGCDLDFSSFTWILEMLMSLNWKVQGFFDVACLNVIFWSKDENRHTQNPLYLWKLP